MSSLIALLARRYTYLRAPSRHWGRLNGLQFQAPIIRAAHPHLSILLLVELAEHALKREFGHLLVQHPTESKAQLGVRMFDEIAERQAARERRAERMPLLEKVLAASAMLASARWSRSCAKCIAASSATQAWREASSALCSAFFRRRPLWRCSAGSTSSCPTCNSSHARRATRSLHGPLRAPGDAVPPRGDAMFRNFKPSEHIKSQTKVKSYQKSFLKTL